MTTSPVNLDIGEARIGIPFVWGRLVIATRVQDDQPRPKRGAAAAIEVSMTANL